MNKDPINILESGNDYLISRLPVELIFDIASRLHYKDIVRLCRTSSYLNQLFCLDDEIWRILYHRDISTYDLPLNKNYYQQYQKVINETKNNNKNVILIYAAENGYDKLVNEMIELGADDYNGAMGSAAYGGHVDIVERMIKLGANKYNWAMSAAVVGGHVDIVERMLQLGADDYNFAMYAAAIAGHGDIVNLIKEWQLSH